MRDRVGTAVGELPRDAEAPVIQKLDPDATPILYIAVKADKPLRELTQIADEQVRPRLENVSGVGQVTVVGGRKRQVNVLVDPVKLRATSITVADVPRRCALRARFPRRAGEDDESGERDLDGALAGAAEH